MLRGGRGEGAWGYCYCRCVTLTPDLWLRQSGGDVGTLGTNGGVVLALWLKQQLPFRGPGEFPLLLLQYLGGAGVGEEASVTL